MVVICWEQLPVYAARSIGMFSDICGEEVVVIRVPTSRFPIKGAAEMTHARVIDVSRDEERTLAKVIGMKPDVVLIGGWGVPCFRRWLTQAHREGYKTIVSTDEPLRKLTFKEVIRKYRFKLVLASRIDRLLLAGGGGRAKFQGWYGFPSCKMREGLYAADPMLFYDAGELTQRPKRFLYVGHFDANKNVLKMCDAFLHVHERHPDWELEICGGGPLEEAIPRKPGILLTGFVPAEKLGEKYRSSRCFVLGSHAEQWGVVVHEAVSSGCALLLSDHVGSRFDFAKDDNSVLFNPDSLDDFERGMERIISFSDEEWRKARSKSLEVARSFSPERFAETLMALVKELRVDSE